MSGVGVGLDHRCQGGEKFNSLTACRGTVHRYNAIVLEQLPAHILQPTQMSQDTISGSPNRQLDCKFNEPTEMGSPNRKSPIQLNFKQTTNEGDRRKGSGCATPPQESNGAPEADHHNVPIAVDGRRNGGGNTRCPTHTSACGIKAREEEFAKNQFLYMKSLLPEQGKFVKIKMIIYLKLRMGTPLDMLSDFTLIQS